jgi:hypothetical protein
MPVKNNHLKLKAGLGLAAVAAAAATYYFFGKHGKAHRKTAATWAHKAKRDAAAELKKLKSFTPANYSKAINKVVAKYQKFQKQHPAEFAALSKELKTAGSKILKHLSAKPKPAAKKKKK